MSAVFLKINRRVVFSIFLFVLSSIPDTSCAEFPLVGTMSKTSYDYFEIASLDGIGTRWIFIKNARELDGQPTEIQVFKSGPSVGAPKFVLDQQIVIPRQNVNGWNIPLWISTHLFDSDDGIEYLLADGVARIRIYDNDGTLLLSKGEPGEGNRASIYASGGVNYPPAISCKEEACYFSVRVEQGNDVDEKTFVYRLPGQYPHGEGGAGSLAGNTAGPSGSGNIDQRNIGTANDSNASGNAAKEIF